VQVALDSLRANLSRARALGGLFAALSQTTKPVLDLTDLLRAEVVLAVSAFDHFIHELARLGTLETFVGTRLPTPAYKRFEVSLEAVGLILANPANPTPLDQEVKLRHSWLTFQKPDKVADALRLVSEKIIWEEVGARVGIPAGDVKARLSAIVDRRNQIAHEADLDPTDPTLQTRWPISPGDADGVVEFLEQIGTAIFEVVR